MKDGTKLKLAAEEIKEILRKHNIAGAVQLHLPGCGEFFVHLNPSYSCAYIYEDEYVRFYSKSEDYKSPEEQLKKQEDTSNMLKILSDTTAVNFNMLSRLSDKFDSISNAEHQSPKLKLGK